MSYIPTDTTKGQDDISWHPKKNMGHSWCGHVHSQ